MLYTATEVLESDRLDPEMRIGQKKFDLIMNQHGFIKGSQDFQLAIDELNPIDINEVTSGLVWSMVDLCEWLGY